MNLPYAPLHTTHVLKNGNVFQKMFRPESLAEGLRLRSYEEYIKMLLAKEEQHPEFVYDYATRLASKLASDEILAPSVRIIPVIYAGQSVTLSRVFISVIRPYLKSFCFNGKNLLHCAASLGYAGLTRVLIKEYDFDVNTPTIEFEERHPETACTLAIKSNDVDTTEIVLSEANCRFNINDYDEAWKDSMRQYEKSMPIAFKRTKVPASLMSLTRQLIRKKIHEVILTSRGEKGKSTLDDRVDLITGNRSGTKLPTSMLQYLKS